jgi:[acyl-carrier-protein] S-malonyltransferase
MSTALLFSGQGAQVVGMGKSLYEGSASAKDLYDRAAKVLPFDLRQACFEGPAELLTETRVCQPALYVQGYAIAQILKERGKLNDLPRSLPRRTDRLRLRRRLGFRDRPQGRR